MWFASIFREGHRGLVRAATINTAKKVWVMQPHRQTAAAD